VATVARVACCHQAVSMGPHLPLPQNLPSLLLLLGGWFHCSWHFILLTGLGLLRAASCLFTAKDLALPDITACWQRAKLTSACLLNACLLFLDHSCRRRTGNMVFGRVGDHFQVSRMPMSGRQEAWWVVGEKAAMALMAAYLPPHLLSCQPQFWTRCKTRATYAAPYRPRDGGLLPLRGVRYLLRHLFSLPAPVFATYLPDTAAFHRGATCSTHAYHSHHV